MGITPLTSLSISQRLGLTSSITSQVPSTVTSQVPSAYKFSSLGVPPSSQPDVVTGSVPASEASLVYSAIAVASTEVSVSTVTDRPAIKSTIAVQSTTGASVVVVVSPSAAAASATTAKSASRKSNQVHAILISFDILSWIVMVVYRLL